ncbi:hypothetical protein [Ramlibacter sp. Leaf400]|uniref:hypothetical protein n=1 Tax=Ramlibacter sp. Leaf400 TaxID=1736365 RepID=UPI0006F2ABC2|nr:hypothetical protein [Ramlibacter sp. Leaf400]KQT13340.1 hypothetical protein ASG30_20510 [Ramlibacter sp. Leaf400]
MAHAPSLRRLFGPWTELRIDVQLPTDSVEAEIERVKARLHAAGRSLRAMTLLDLRLPGLAFRHREADGEHFVYVEDLANGRLAGCTVFNRLIELDRRADRLLRSPHSKYGRLYQRRGIASAVYRWALDRGMCLISGPRQSTGAHALWHSLAKHHPLGYVTLKDKGLGYLGRAIGAETLEDFHTRMILLGQGWDLEGFLREVRATVPEPTGASALHPAA